MKAGLIPENEAARLAAVARYGILDTDREEAFDRLTALTARLLDAPAAMMSIVDSERVWVKSALGLELQEVPRHEAMCAMTILQDRPYQVADASADPRWKDTPLVAGEAGIRFYAAAQLRTSDGFNLGGLCVIDQRPRKATPQELETLEDLASLAMHQLDLRLAALGESESKAPAEEISWEDPPQRKVRPPEEWAPLLDQVAQRPGHWAKLRHYDGETSAYRAAAQLRERTDLPEGHWEFLARRSPEGGSDLFSRLSASKPTDRRRPS